MERMPEYSEEKFLETSRSGKKRIENLFNQIQTKRPDLTKQLEKNGLI